MNTLGNPFNPQASVDNPFRHEPTTPGNTPSKPVATPTPLVVPAPVPGNPTKATPGFVEPIPNADTPMSPPVPGQNDPVPSPIPPMPTPTPTPPPPEVAPAPHAAIIPRPKIALIGPDGKEIDPNTGLPYPDQTPSTPTTPPNTQGPGQWFLAPSMVFTGPVGTPGGAQAYIWVPGPIPPTFFIWVPGGVYSGPPLPNVNPPTPVPPNSQVPVPSPSPVPRPSPQE